MNLTLAHITGIPHHTEEAQSVLALWPLVLLAIELTWVVVCQRGRQFARAMARAGLATVGVYALAIFPITTARAATSSTVLRSASGKLIGSIETNSIGTQELRDSNRRLIGTYNPSTNQTKDSSGRLVGSGNLLTSLLH